MLPEALRAGNGIGLTFMGPESSERRGMIPLKREEEVDEQDSVVCGLAASLPV